MLNARLPRVGDELPPFSRTTELENWNRFAAVNDEFVDIHMADDAARARGEHGAIGMGNLRTAYLHAMVRTWAGEDGDIVSLWCEHRAINQRGDTLTCRGRVVTLREHDDRTLCVVLALSVERQGGILIDQGEAVVLLPCSSAALAQISQ